MDNEVKERPKVGDRVEFRSQRAREYGVRIGTVIAVAETGVHFRIETPFTTARKPWESECNQRQLRIPLSAIIRILPERRLDE